jgi:hypothetical protein
MTGTSSSNRDLRPSLPLLLPARRVRYRLRRAAIEPPAYDWRRWSGVSPSRAILTKESRIGTTRAAGPASFARHPFLLSLPLTIPRQAPALLPRRFLHGVMQKGWWDAMPPKQVA